MIITTERISLEKLIPLRISRGVSGQRNQPYFFRSSTTALWE